MVLAVTKKDLEEELDWIMRFLVTLKPPEGLSQKEGKTFTQKVSWFDIQGLSMFKKCKHLPPQKVIFPIQQQREILTELHEGIGHRGE